jgi:hypothetical protein
MSLPHPLDLPARLLCGPGPSDVEPSVLDALRRPMLGHLDPAFHAVLDETAAMLRDVWRAGDAEAFALPATDTSGMEAGLANLLEPGDVAIVAEAGSFGRRLGAMTERLGARVVRVGAQDGEAVANEDLLAAATATRRRGCSPSCTPRPRRASSTRWPRSPPRSPTKGRCSWPTASRRSAACRSTWPPGGSTMPTPARRSASPRRRAWRPWPSRRGHGSGSLRAARRRPSSLDLALLRGYWLERPPCTAGWQETCLARFLRACGPRGYGGSVRAVLIALACCAVLAPAARAQPVTLLDTGRTAALAAIAGDQAIVARSTRAGAVTIDALPADGGGPPLRILDLPASGGGAAVIDLVAAPGQVAALVLVLDEDETSLVTRIYSGPVSGPLTVLREARFGGRAWAAFEVDVDATGRVLAMELSLARLSARGRIYAPGAAPVRVAWPESIFGPAAIAGDLVAFVADADTHSTRDHLFVVDTRTGARVGDLDIRDSDRLGESDVDLAPDGRLVAAVKGRLVQLAPGAPAATVPGAASRTLASPVFAGASVAALEAGRFGASRPVLVGAAPRVLGEPSTRLDAIDAEDDQVVWLANGCLHADVPAPAAAPPAACPSAEVAFHDPGGRLRGRSLRTRVACVSAAAGVCSGTVVVPTGAGAGRASFSIPAGTERRVRVRFTRRVARRVRREIARHRFAPLATVRVDGGRAYRVHAAELRTRSARERPLTARRG